MVYCHKCGKKNDDDAEYCIKCGTYISNSRDFEKDIEKFAERFGNKAEQIGKKIEKRGNDAGYHFNQWYNKTFKITGPLIGAFIALIILRVIIYAIQISGEDIFIVTTLGEGLYEYLLIIFLSMLLTGYNNYFYRKYKYQYQMIYPLISAIGFIIGAWIVAQILIIISQSNDTPILEAIGNFFNTYLVVIFIFAIIISYITQFVFVLNKAEEKKMHHKLKQCSNCKTENNSNAKYCWKCGKKV